MGTYSRTYTIDSSPSGDTTKAAIATKLDGDLTNIFTNLTSHEAMTTGAHGVGSGTIVGTALTQTLTNKTISTPTISGVATLSSATLSGGGTLVGTFTGGTLASCTLSGTVTASSATLSAPVITGGSSTNMTLTTPTLTGTITNTDGTITGGIIASCTMTGTITTTGASFGAMTLSAPTLTGTVTASGATIVSPTLTGATLAGALTLGTASMTADYKAFVNAAGTAPEWAKGIYSGTITRDMASDSGDVSYTGIGFKGSILMITGTLDSATIMTVFGFDNGTTRYCTYGNYDGYFYRATTSCIISGTGTTPGNTQTAVLKTWDSDGFTLTWTKTGSPTTTMTVGIIVLR